MLSDEGFDVWRYMSFIIYKFKAYTSYYKIIASQRKRIKEKQRNYIRDII